MLTSPLLLVLLASPLAAPVAQATKVTPPPGMVLIEGGKTKIGSELKTIEKLILEDPEAEERARSLLGETPQHTVDVAPFFLMVTEVTNEQYQTYVQATGARPPEHWGERAVLEAQALFVTEQGKARQEAKERGEKLPAAETFQQQQWWFRNWKDAEWAVPEGHELFPVRFVSYEDAQNYARWAGLRLMSEDEYQRAVRDGSDRLFPWGDKFEASRTVSSSEDKRRGEPLRVAARPDGANEVGIHDLIGNVWEWTTTHYSAYQGYEPLEVKLDKGKRKVRVEAPWDANLRVIVGGSYQSSSLACRATVRRRTERSQTTEAVGFRCAASVMPGLDLSRSVLDNDLPLRVRPDDEGGGKVKYRPEGAVTIDRWKAKTAPPASLAKVEADDEAGTLEAAAPKSQDGPPPGYALIEGYEYVVFIPVEIVKTANVSDLRKSSVEADSTPIGVLKTTFPLLQPALPAGTYMISFRGAGEKRVRNTPRPAKDGEETEPAQGGEGVVVEVAPEPTLVERIGLDISVDTYVFFDDSGEPVAFMPAATWDHQRTSPGAMNVVEIELSEMNEEGEEITWTEKRLNVEGMVDSLVSSKGYRFTIPLKLDEAVLERPWR